MREMNTMDKEGSYIRLAIGWYIWGWRNPFSWRGMDASRVNAGVRLRRVLVRT
jgi:hypothetical protein